METLNERDRFRRFALSDDAGEETRRFLSMADRGSMTATLYSVPYDRNLLNPAAGRLVVNFGNQTEEGDRTLAFAREEAQRGVGIELYSDPSQQRRIHMKTYVATSEGDPVAFISTGNLSKYGLAQAPRDLRERIRQIGASASKEVFETNLTVAIRDPQTVRSLAEVQATALKGEIPYSHRNVLVGGQATDVVVANLLRTKRGESVTISGPYLDDPKIVASLIEARKKGANVTVITSNPDSKYPRATTDTWTHRVAMSQLSAAGIKVVMPKAQDPLLLHTKALSIVGRDRGTLFLGSHNFTSAATQDRSVDLLLALNNPELARQLQGYLGSMEKDYQLIEYHARGDAQPMNGIERRMYLLGSGELYKVMSPTSDPITNYATKRSQNKGLEPEMPYFPTVMDQEFFTRFLGAKHLPKVSIYADLYRARTGELKVPGAILQMDKEISQPGLGYLINKVFGANAYQNGFGFIGSAVTGAGRFIDWALGFDEYREKRKEQEKKDRGSVNRMMGTQYQAAPGAGPAEKMATQLYATVAGVAKTTAFYVGVNLPVQYLKAAFEADYFNLLITLPQDITARNWMGSELTKALPRLQSLTFGDAIGGAISEVIKDPEIRHDNFADKLYAAIIENDVRKIDLSRVAKTHEGRLTSIKLSEEGLFSWMTQMRRFDTARFGSLTSQFLELFNPYDVGVSHHRMYQAAVRRVEETVGLMPLIEFQQRPDNPNVYTPVFRNVGTERVRQIARSYDEVAALLPANIAYWTPPLRRVLGLEDFDPRHHMTVRDMMSFEDAVKWTEYFYQRVGKFISSPAENVKKVVKAWRNEQQIARIERSLLQGMVQTPVASVPPLASTAEESLVQLYEHSAQTYQSRTAEIEGLLQDSRFHEYRNTLVEQRQLLEQSPFHALDVTFAASENPYKTVDTPAGRRVGQVRRTLTTVGMIIVADQFLDDLLLKPLGANLITQIRARQALDTDDGTVAKFQFSGVLPRWMTAGVQLGAGLTTGLLLPSFVDVGDRPGGFIDRLDSLRGFQKDLTARQREIADAAEGPILESTRVITSREKSSQIRAVYRTLQESFSSTMMRRTALRFNMQAALVGAFVAGIAAKGVAMGTAYLLNLAYNRESSFQVGSTDAMLSSRFEYLSVRGLERARSMGDYVNSAMGLFLARQYLRPDSSGHRVYSVVSQITTPFFQIPAVVRFDTQKKKAQLSIGLQSMHALGLGFTPILPFAIQLRKTDDNDPYYFQRKYGGRQLLMSVIRGGISTLTFGSGLVYDKDSMMEKGMEFVGLTTLLSMGAERFARGYQRLLRTHESSSAIVRHLTDLEENTRALRAVIGGAAMLSNQAIRSVYSLAPSVVHSTVTSALSVFKTEATEKIPEIKTPRFVRKLAPYYLALMMSRLMSDPQGDYVGKDFEDPLVQVQATLGAGLLTGFLLDKTGVFASSKDLAAEFHRVKGVDTQSLVQGWIPKAVARNEHAEQEIRAVLERMERISAEGSRQLWVPSRRLLAQASGETLWQEAVERYARPEYRGLEEKAPLYMTEEMARLPGGKFRSMSARIAIAGTVLFGVKAAAFTIANSFSSDRLRALYKVPLVGPTIRLLAGVEPEKDKLEPTEHGVRQADAPRGLIGLVNRFVKTLSFGTIDLSKALGFYTNPEDPFINSIGPFGASFKPKRTSTYIQYASAFTDISASGYDMLAGRVSEDLLKRTIDVFANRRPQSVAEALALVRGATPRQKHMEIRDLTGYDLEAARQSTGLIRAVKYRHFLMQHLAAQRPSELMFDLMKEGMTFGLMGHSAIPGYRLPPTGYRPMGFLKNVTFTIQQNNLESGAMKALDPELSIMSWYGTTEWKHRAVNQGFSALRIGYDISSLKGYSYLTIPIQLVLLASAAYAGVGVIGGLAASQTYNELKELTHKSRLNRGRPVSPLTRYAFTSGRLPSGRPAAFQVDQLNPLGGLYRLPLDIEETATRTGATPLSITVGITEAYRSLHSGLNQIFTENYSKRLASLVKLASEGPLDEVQKELFKQQFVEDIQKHIDKSMRVEVVPGTTLFQSIIGAGDQHLNQAIDLFTQEMEGFSQSAITDVLTRLDEEAAVGIDSFKTTLKLNVALEQNEAFQHLLLKLQRPIVGTYDLRAERSAYGRIARLDTENTIRAVKRTPRAEVGLSSEVRRQMGDYVQRPWSEGAVTTTLKAGKGLASGVAWWTANGRSAYEVIEAAGVMMGGATQSTYLRQKAGEQFVSSSFSWATAVGLAEVAMGIGASPLLAMAAAVGGLVAFDALKQKSGSIRSVETNLVEGLGNLLAFPVKTVASVFRPLGLERPVRQLGNLLAAPFSFLGRILTAPVRAFTENISGPLIQDQTFGMVRDPIPIQMVKGFFLPQSVYSNFSFNEGTESSLGGQSPFMSGNITMVMKKRQVEALQSAMRINPMIEKQLVYGDYIGFEDSESEKLAYKKYFHGTGGRVWSDFALHRTRVSRTLMMALERRQALFNVLVTTQAIARQPPPVDLSLLSHIYGGAATLRAYRSVSNLNPFEELQKDISTVRNTIGDWHDDATRFINARIQPFSGAVSRLAVPLQQLRRNLLAATLRAGRRLSRSIPLPSLPELAFLEKLKGFRINLPAFSIPHSLTDRALDLGLWGLEGMSSLLQLGRGAASRLRQAIAPRIVGGVTRAASWLSGILSFARPVSESVGTARAKADPVLRFINNIPARADYPMDNLDRYLRRLIGLSQEMMEPLKKVLSFGMRRGLDRGIGTLMTSLPKVPIGPILLSRLELLIAQQTDYRLSSLGRGSSYKEYRETYREVGMSLGGYTAGAAALSLVERPLPALIASALGSFVGGWAGENLALGDYRRKDKNPVLNYLKQSALVGSLSTLTQLPKLLSIARAQGLRAAAMRGAANFALSSAFGLFTGPTTQLSLTGMTMDSYDWVQRNQRMIRSSVKKTLSFFQALPDLFSLLFRGRVSSTISQAARESVVSLKEEFQTGLGLNRTALSGTPVSFDGSPFQIEGMYNLQEGSVTLSKASESVLGRMRAGKFVRPSAVTRAIFDAFHEMSHAIEFQRTLPKLNIDDLQVIAYETGTETNRLQDIVERVSKSSAMRTLDEFKFGQDILQEMLRDEISANVRALGAFSATHRDQFEGLTNTLDRETRIDDIAHRYSILMETLPPQEGLRPPVRYRGRPLIGGMIEDIQTRSGETLRGLLTEQQRFRSLGSIAENAFVALDFMLGIHSVHKFETTVQTIQQAKIRGSFNRLQAQRELAEARDEQMGVMFGSIAGNFAAFFSGRWWTGLAAGLTVGVLSRFGFFGLSSWISAQDLKDLDNGNYVYNPMQSSSVYIRLNRSFEKEATVGQFLTGRVRQALRPLVSKTLRYLAEAGPKITRVVSQLTAIAASALPVLTGVISSGLSAIASGTQFLLKGWDWNIRLRPDAVAQVHRAFDATRRFAHGLFQGWDWNIRLRPEAIRQMRQAYQTSRLMLQRGAQYLSESWSWVSNLHLFQGGTGFIKKLFEGFSWNVQFRQEALNQIGRAFQTSRSFVGSLFEGWDWKVRFRQDAIDQIGRGFRASGQFVKGLFEGWDWSIKFRSGAVSQIRRAFNVSQRFIGGLLSGASDWAGSMLNVSRHLFDGFSWNIKFRSEAVDQIRRAFQFLNRPTGLLGLTRRLFDGFSWNIKFRQEAIDQIRQTFSMARDFGRSLFEGFSWNIKFRQEALDQIRGAYETAKTIPGRVSTWALDHMEGIAQKFRLLPSHLIKGFGWLKRVLTRANHFIGQAVEKGLDQVVLRMSRLAPKMSEYVLTHGYREGILSAIAPVVDLTTLGGGALKALRLNKTSSLTDVEEAYAQMGGAKGSLVGSILGVFSGGVLGDISGSILGQVGGAEEAVRVARMRYEAKDYGAVPILEDILEPGLKQAALAKEAGQAIGFRVSTLTERYLAAANVRVLSGSASLMDRIATSASRTYAGALTRASEAAQARFLRVFGKSAPEVGELAAKFAKPAGFLARGAGHVLRFAGPIIDIWRIGSGVQKAQTARSEVEYKVALRRTTGGIGSLGGGIIGGSLAGPIAAIAGSLIGDYTFSKIGEKLGSEAFARRVGAKTVVRNQLLGGIGGAVLGGLAAAGLVAAGIVSAPILLLAGVGIGAGLLIGSLAGSFSSFLGTKDLRHTKREGLSYMPVHEASMGLTNPEIQKIIRAQPSRDSWIRKKEPPASTGLMGLLRSVGDGFKNLWWNAEKFARDALTKLNNVAKGLMNTTAKVREGLSNALVDLKDQVSSAFTDSVDGVGRLTPYTVWSLGGRRYGEGIARSAEELRPHWEGTGGYVRYRMDHGKLKSYLDNGQRVVDIQLNRGSSTNVPVPSPVEGKVIFAGFVGELGMIKIQDASGAVTRVLHNKTIEVKAGQTVRFGQRLGIQGSTGETSTAVHVHLETSEALLQRYMKALVSGDFGSRKGNVGATNISAARRAFLDMIGYSEGADYNVMFTGRRFSNFADHPRTVMSGGGIRSDAAGRYQFMSFTWDDARKALGLKDFSPASQDKAALWLIQQQGALADIDAGRINVAMRKLRSVWASFPDAPYGQPTRRASELLQYYWRAFSRYAKPTQPSLGQAAQKANENQPKRPEKTTRLKAAAQTVDRHLLALAANPTVPPVATAAKVVQFTRDKVKAAQQRLNELKRQAVAIRPNTQYQYKTQDGIIKEAKVRATVEQRDNKTVIRVATETSYLKSWESATGLPKQSDYITAVG
jgi:muramidase (phage lysozyme)